MKRCIEKVVPFSKVFNTGSKLFHRGNSISLLDGDVPFRSIIQGYLTESRKSWKFLACVSRIVQFDYDTI